MAATVHQLQHRPPPSGGTGPANMTQAFPSSFGMDQTTMGPELDVKGLVNSERVKELEYRERFYTCTQHDRKIFDFNGRLVRAGRIPGVQPLIGTSAPSWYVPMDMRRPSAPYRLGRKIVGSFTGMLFGKGRFPQPRSDDPATQDWAEALVEAVSMRTRFIRARNIGGACGTVGVSWRFHDGSPRISVHHGKHIHVLEWVDHEEYVPKHVVELYQFQRSVFDPIKKMRVLKWFWHRRDWVPDADVFFIPVEVKDSSPQWVVDEERSFKHGEGECHFVYIPNLPDDDPATEDGVPDYAETYEQMNTLDILNSVACRGGVLNLDPTLVLKMERDEIGGAVVRKGSDNALTVGPSGDAHYMELSGNSITAGGVLIDRQRDQILEVSECVVADPDKVAAAGTSSVALKVVYSPMIGKTDLMRDQYGEGGILRVLDGMTRSARRWVKDPAAETPDQQYVHEQVMDEETGQPVVGDDGEPVEEPVEYFVELPPRIEQREVLGDDGAPTGEVESVKVERHPGAGRVWLEWGPYFKPTADDHSKDAQAATVATGGKPVLSQQTAVELTAQAYDRDATEEWTRVRAEAAQRDGEQEGMFPPLGGEDLPGDGAEAGAEGAEGEAAPAGEGEQAAAQVAAQEAVGVPKGAVVEITATDIAKIVTVNEARSSQGLGPLVTVDGVQDPDGGLTVAEFTKKREEGAKATSKVAVESAKAAAAPADGKPDLGPGVELTATDSAKIVTVREARAGKGLGPLILPDGTEDPDMSLTVEEYTTKRKEKAEAQAAISVEQAKQAGGEPPGGGGQAPPGAPPVPPGG